MKNSQKNAQMNIRLNAVMEALNVNATDLSRESGVERTLISRWQTGDRPLTQRSKQLLPLAKAMVRLDTSGALDELLTAQMQRGMDKVEALVEFLPGEDLIALPSSKRIANAQASGEYDVHYRVYLGQKGFYKVALENVAYLAATPPGTELAALCQGSYEWFTGSIPFLMQFLSGLRRAVQHGGRFLVIIRRGYTAAETALFAGPWLLFHLRGYIRSRYYEGELPAGMRFAASIPDYLGTWVEEDTEVEDHLYAELHTDPRGMRRAEAAIAEYRIKSYQSSQYGFFRNPLGDEADPRLWKEGSLPPWERGEMPDGSFFALCRLPGIGVMTKGEFDAVLGEGEVPALPEYLFRETGEFAPGPHRIILCREDVREALAKKRRLHEPLSAIAGRRVFVPHGMLVDQLSRLVAAMGEREDFEVALLPRVAFTKLQMEMVCWKNSVSVAWLQDMQESVFADEAPTSGSFHGFLDYVWGKMLAGWKRKSAVARQLRKWMAGKGLDAQEEDSTVVKNWEVLPK